MSRMFLNIFLICIMSTMLYSGNAFFICGPNSRPQRCADLCPRTCARPEVIFCNPINPDRCKIGCACDEGYVKGSTGRCIEPEQCPKQRPPYSTSY